MTATEAREEIEILIATAQSLIPKEMLEMLPTEEGLYGEPAWRSFEGQIWKTGESIRIVLCKHPRLRADNHIQRMILDVACDRRAHRGRQSFFMLLAFRCCQTHATRVAEHLDDNCVAGHVIGTLYKMRAPGFSTHVRPFATHNRAWIRNEAKRYLVWDANR